MKKRVAVEVQNKVSLLPPLSLSLSAGVCIHFCGMPLGFGVLADSASSLRVGTLIGVDGARAILLLASNKTTTHNNETRKKQNANTT